MANADDYAQWIVANQSKKGTPEFNTVAQAYQEAKLESSSGIDYKKLTAQKAQDDALRQRLQGENWLSRNIEGALTAPSNLLEGVKQGAYELTHARNPLDVEQRGKPMPQYDTSKIRQNRVIASEAPVGAIAGNVATALPLAFAPGGTTALGGVGYGTLYGATLPTLEGESRLENAISTGLMGGVVPTTSALAKDVKAIVEPLTEAGKQRVVSRTLQSAVGSEAPNVSQRLRMAQELIAGSKPTAAEVAESGGISALQRAAMQANPEAYTLRNLEQQSARSQALRGIAKDAPSIAEAEKVRKQATKPLFDTFDNTSIQVDKDLQGILNRLPGGVLSKAKDLARQEGTAFTVTAGERGAGHPLMPQEAKEAITTINGNALGNIDKALKDAINGIGENALGPNEKRIAMQTRAELLLHLEKNIPEYKQAMSEFSRLSQPINQMQVGQNLIEKISPALSDFGALGKETAAKYAQALRNSLQTVKEATGFEQPIEKLMTPKQMETLTNVGKDLARRSNMQELGRGVGSNTFQNMAMDNLISQSANPKMTGLTLKTLDAILNKIPVANALSPSNLMKGENQALQQKLAEALLNPQEAARLMDLANKMPSAKGEMLKKLIQGGMLSFPAQNQGEQ